MGHVVLTEENLRRLQQRTLHRPRRETPHAHRPRRPPLRAHPSRPGQRVCPFHSHSAQWELFWITAGSATVRADTARHTFSSGDLLLHPPGEAHEIFNASATEPFEFLLLADNPPSEYWHYPDSGKWGFRAPRNFFRPADADYWDGEE
jgi:mannose-6-phosphate isomerase-like protein (cupin superfamily)